MVIIIIMPPIVIVIYKLCELTKCNNYAQIQSDWEKMQMNFH